MRPSGATEILRNIEKRVNELQSEVNALRIENKDLHARVEELEEREGLSDGENEDEWVERAVKDEVRQDMERRNRRRMQDRGQLACLGPQEDENAETGEEYEDPAPSFVGAGAGRMDTSPATLSDSNRDSDTGAPVIVPFGGEDRCPATLDKSFRDFLVYSDDYDTYWISSYPILAGERQGIPFRGPEDLRELADQIERAEQDSVKERVPRETVDEYHYYEGEL